ncbi:hypothetical protein CAMRE0001_2837 [Campylobacter rectus RM3267]|uniref:Uncharacterized protein n=1 Tax=Campylobacter rectus RM3267 TaxID=553218 RepID=B9D127_CAMRE|nr:hypothetical protein CAMRE0001_2837 [Campylobacter rectus RM3267]
MIARSSGIHPNFSVLNWAFILSFRLSNFARVFKSRSGAKQPCRKVYLAV